MIGSAAPSFDGAEPPSDAAAGLRRRRRRRLRLRRSRFGRRAAVARSGYLGSGLLLGLVLLLRLLLGAADLLPAACAGATCATVPSARAGCRRAHWRSPGSRRVPRGPGRARCSRAACTPRRRRGARRRLRAATPSRPGSASRRSPRAGGHASSRPLPAGAWPPGTRCWRDDPAPSASPWRASTSSAGESDRGVRLAFPDRAEQDPRARRPVLVPRRRLADEGHQIVEVGALDGHRDAVLERGHPQTAVWILGRADREERLERRLRRARPSANFFANSARWSKRSCRPAMVAQ